MSNIETAIKAIDDEIMVIKEKQQNAKKFLDNSDSMIDNLEQAKNRLLGGSGNKTKEAPKSFKQQPEKSSKSNSTGVPKNKSLGDVPF